MSEMPDTSFPASIPSFPNVDFSTLPTLPGGGIDWAAIGANSPLPDFSNVSFPTPATTPTDFWGALTQITRDVTNTIRGGQVAKVQTAVATHPAATQTPTSPLLLFGGLGIAALLLLGGGKGGKK